MAEYTQEGKETRHIDNLTKYGEAAQAKYLQSKRALSAKYGKDFEGEFAAIFDAASYYAENGLPIDPAAKGLATETLDKIKKIQEDPDFQDYQDAVSALDKSSKEYSVAMSSSTTMRAAQRFRAERQATVDEEGDYSVAKVGRWAARKGAELTRSIATLPAHIAIAATSRNNPKYGAANNVKAPRLPWAESMINFFDSYVQDVSDLAPEQTSRQGNIFRKEADFEGLRVEIDGSGDVVQVRKQNGNNAAVDAEFNKRFKESGKAAEAKERTLLTARGIMPSLNTDMADQIASKTIDAVADIFLMRGMGGGKLAGTAAASFVMQYPQAFHEAQKDLGMSVADASRYALTTGLITATLEAHIGKIETAGFLTRFKPTISAQTVKMVAGGQMNAAQAAWAAYAPIIKEIGSEVGEEMATMVAENANKMVFNAVTGANLDTSIEKNEIKETILITALATGGMAVNTLGDSGDRLHHQAVLAGVKNPQRFNEVGLQMVEDGSITPEDFAKASENIARLGKYNESLPQDMPDEQRAAVLGLQWSRDEADEIATSEMVLPAVAAQARKEVKDIDYEIGQVLAAKVEAPAAEPPKETELPPAVSLIAKDVETDTDPTPNIVNAIEEAGVFPVPPAVVDSIKTEIESVSDATQVAAIMDDVLADAGIETDTPLDPVHISSVVDKVAATVSEMPTPPATVQKALEAASMSTETEKGAKKAAVKAMEVVMERKGYGEEDVAKAKKAAKKGTAMTVARNVERIMEAPPAQFTEPDPTPDDGPDDVPDTGRPDDVTIEDVQKANTFIDGLLKGIPKQQQDALEEAIDLFSNDEGGIEAGRFLAAVNGRGDALDMAVVQDLEQNHPAAFAAIKSLIDESTREIRTQDETTEFDAESDSAGSGTQARSPSADTGEADSESTTPRTRSAALAIADEEALADAEKDLAEAELPAVATAEMAEELLSAGATDLKTAALVIGSRGKSEGAAVKAAKGRIVAAQEGAKKLTAKDRAAAAGELARINGDTNPAFVLSEEDGKFYVANVEGSRDIMNMLGGKKEGDVWSFPASKKDKVVQSIRLLTETPSDRKAFGESAPALKNKKVLEHRRHTERLLERATSTKERVEVIKRQLGDSKEKRLKLTQKVLKQLQAAFPAVKIYVDVANYEMALTKARPKSGKRPAAFVLDGKVYLDPSRTGPETIIHEVGHLLNMWVKATQPALYARQMEALRGSEYEAAVRESGDYDNTNEEAILDEAAAMLIGEQGARLANETQWESATRFLTDMGARFLETFGVKTTDSLERFGRKQAAMLLKGDAISKESGERIAALGRTAKFMFIGQRGNLPSDVRDSLIVAKILHDQGWSNAMIQPSTNWWMGPDGKWRWEVSGFRAVSNMSIAPGDTIAIEDILAGSDLLRIYPDIGTRQIKIVQGEKVLSSFEENGVTLTVPAETLVNDEVIGQVIASAQRLVQLREGFATTPQEVGDDYRALMDGAEIIFLGQMEQAEAVRRRALSDEDRRSAPAWTQIAPHERIVFFGDDSAFSNTAVPGYEVDATVYGGTPEARYSFATDNLFEDAKHAAIRSLLEIEITNPTGKPDAVHIELALEFEIPISAIKKIDAEVRHQHAERVAKETALKNKVVKWAMDRILSSRRWLTRQFGYKSILPQQIWDALQKRRNAVNGQLERMKLLSEDFDTVFKQVYGKPKDDDLLRERRKAIWRVMTGQAPENSIDTAFIPIVREMRALVDGLSRNLLYFGTVPKGTIVSVLENLGIETDTSFSPEEIETLSEVLAKRPSERTNEEADMVEDFIRTHSDLMGRYLTRTYKVHRVDNWEAQLDSRVRDKAIAHLTRKYMNELEKIKERIGKRGDNTTENLLRAEKRITEVSKKLDAMLAEASLANDAGKMAEAKGSLAAVQEVLSLSDEELAAFFAGSDPSLAPITNLYALTIAKNRRIAMDAKKAIGSDKNADVERMKELENLLSQPDKGIRWMIADWQKDAVSIGGARKSGAKDLSVLKRREQIDPEIRELMGEDVDPVISFEMSVFKMAHLLEAQKMLSFLADNFEGTLFSRDANRLPDHTIQVAAESSNAFAPLNGFYTSQDVADGLADIGKRFLLDPEHPLHWWLKFTQAVKFGKVILSPAAIFRNPRGNLRFPLMNGWSVVGESVRLLSDFRTNKVAWRNRLIEWADFGITGKSISKGDLEATFESISRTLPDSVTEKASRGSAKAATKILNVFREAFAAGDTFFRIIGFESEKRKYARAWYKQEFNDLDDAHKQRVREKASKIVNGTTPNYDYIPQFIRKMRAVPVFGTFISFPTEMFRVSYNTVAIAVDEIRDPRTRHLGIRRMIGIAASQALVRGIQTISLMLLGIDEEDEQNVRKLQPEYEKFDTRLYLPSEAGDLRYVNLSYEDPLNFLDATRAFSQQNRHWSDKILDFSTSLIEPYISPELSLTTLARVAFNKRETGGVIYHEGFGGPFAEENAAKTLDYMRQKLQPGVTNILADLYMIGSGNNILTSGKELTVGQSFLEDFVGIKAKTFDVDQSLFFGLKDTAAKKTSIKAAVNSVRRLESKKYEKFKDNGGDGDKLKRQDERAKTNIIEVFDDAQAQYAVILKDASDKVEAAVSFGVPIKKIQKTLKDAGFNQNEIKAILSKNFSLPLQIARLDGVRY